MKARADTTSHMAEPDAPPPTSSMAEPCSQTLLRAALTNNIALGETILKENPGNFTLANLDYVIYIAITMRHADFAFMCVQAMPRLKRTPLSLINVCIEYDATSLIPQIIPKMASGVRAAEYFAVLSAARGREDLLEMACALGARVDDYVAAVAGVCGHLPLMESLAQRCAIPVDSIVSRILDTLVPTLGNVLEKDRILALTWCIDAGADLTAIATSEASKWLDSKTFVLALPLFPEADRPAVVAAWRAAAAAPGARTGFAFAD